MHFSKYRKSANKHYLLECNGTRWNRHFNISGLAQGDILYYNGTAWVRLGAGTNGQALITGGTGANPEYGDSIW